MSGKSLLLVEDDPDDIELIKMHLERSGIDRDIIVRRDGCEAMDLLDSLKSDPSRLPELIIADIKMPRMTGLEMIRHVREDPRLKHLYVVILTTSSNASDLAEALRWGARLFLQKPLEYQEFGEIVRQIKQILDSPRPTA